MRGQLLLKIAVDAEHNRQVLAGGALTVGGAGLADTVHRKGLLTGKETLWHATGRGNVKGIKEQGLKGSKAGKGTFTAEAVVGVNPKSLENKTYLARKRNIALNVGLVRRLHGYDKDGTRIIKAKVPLGVLKEVSNPELDDMPYGKAHSRKMTNMIGPEGTATFEGSVPSKYIVGGKGFKRTRPREIVDFARKHPGKFGKGIAGLAGSAVLAGAGIKLMKGRKEDSK